MKSIKNKYHLIYDFRALSKAHYSSRKRKRDKKDVIEFERFLNANISQLQQELRDKTYELGEYRIFIEKYPKKRLIMYLPYRDRLVQRAFCDTILTPWLETLFIYDNYANRKEKGTHFGINRFEGFLKDYYNKFGIEDGGWVLKADISKYFPSIDHEVIKSNLYPRIKDKDVIWLLDLLIDSVNRDDVQEKLKYYHKLLGFPDARKGLCLPVGNMVFQTLAVFHMNSLDWFCKEELGIKYYSRYMDDFVLVHKDKEYLQYCLKEIEKLLGGLKLTLNPKTQIFPLKNGVDYLGWHFYLTETGKVVKKIRKDSKKGMKNKVRYFNKAYEEGVMDFDSINQSVQSWLGHAEHGDTYHLRKNILNRLNLKRKEEI